MTRFMFSCAHAGKCPAENSGDVSTNCACTGQNEDDCDAYSRIMAYIFLFMERFMGVIIHINDYSQKYHIENVSCDPALQ